MAWSYVRVTINICFWQKQTLSFLWEWVASLQSNFTAVWETLQAALLNLLNHSAQTHRHLFWIIVLFSGVLGIWTSGEIIDTSVKKLVEFFISRPSEAINIFYNSSYSHIEAIKVWYATFQTNLLTKKWFYQPEPSEKYTAFPLTAVIKAKPPN